MAPAGPLPRLTVAPRDSHRWTPWQALCFALLEDALQCAVEPRRCGHISRSQIELQKRNDQRWLAGVAAPLDFATVCAVLDLEPTAVRRALRSRR